VCPVDLKASTRAAFLQLPVAVQRRVLQQTGHFAPWANGEAPKAPEAPSGMVTGAPDFVGIGVPKSGTSWWFSLVLAHPDVHGPIKKELLFFNRVFFEKFRGRTWTEEDLRAYHGWFPRPPGAKTGEWTPSYIFFHRLPPILRMTAPDAKILILLRDPIERYKSDISRRMNRERLSLVRYRGLARGFYSAELEPWEDEYDPSEVLLMQYEACTRDPAAQLAATYRFLGLDDTFRPAQLHAAVNKTKAKRDIDPGFTHLLTELYEPDVVRLAARYPQVDLTLWPNFSYLADS
jgi:hypothetical protein